jgi:WD40 repeat protein
MSPRPLPSIPDHVLLRRIGAGAYGEVWLARNLMGTGRAVKIVRREDFEDDRPFEREFAGLKRFEPVSRGHPGLVQILHIGRPEGDGAFYYVMELADAAALASGEQDTQFFHGYQPRTLRAVLRESGGIGAVEVIDLATALADALGHLHGCGLLHRDIKPANIIFVGGRPKLADIGLVAMAGDTRSFVGTEGYSPPEGPGSEKADLYALGKLLYEASTGRDRMDFPALPARWLDHPERELLLELNEVWARACDRDPSRRYGSAREMLADLAQLRVGRSVRRMRRMEVRLRWTLRTALGLAIGGVVTVAGWGWAERQAHQERSSRERLERAEAAARTNLALARLEAARGWTVSRQAGHRNRAIAALQEAAVVLGPQRELRDAAVAALAGSDLEVDVADSTGPVPYRLMSSLRMGAEWIEGGEFSLRRVRDGGEARRLKAGEPMVSSTGWFSADDRWFGAIGSSGRIWVWPMETNGPPEAFPGGASVAFDFLREPARLVTGDADGIVRVWNLGGVSTETRGPVVETRLERPLLWVGPAPKGQLALATSAGVELRDGHTLGRTALLPGPVANECQLTFSADGRFAAVLRTPREAVLWSVPEQRELAVVNVNGRYCSTLSLLGSGYLLSSGWDGRMRLFQLPGSMVEVEGSGGFSRTMEAPVEGNVLSVALWQPHRGGRVRVVGPSFALPVSLPTLPRVGTASVRIAWAPDGGSFVTVTSAGLDWFDGRTGEHRKRVLETLPVAAWFGERDDSLWVVNQGQVWKVRLRAMGPDAWEKRDPIPATARHAAGTADGRRVAVLADAEWVVVGEGREWGRGVVPPVTESIALSPDAQWVATGVHQGDQCELWSVKDGKRVAAWRDGPSILMWFNPQGTEVCSVSSTGIRWRDLATLQERRVDVRHETAGAAGFCAWDAQGRRMAWLRTRREIVFGEAGPGGQDWFSVEPFLAEPVLEWSPDGTRVAMMDNEGRGRLWDLVGLERELARLGLSWKQSLRASPGE